MPQKPTKITTLHRIIGALCASSEIAMNMTQLGVLSYMAFGELETQTFYVNLAGMARRQSELELSKAFGKTSHTEGLHLAYQKAEAIETASRMGPLRVRAIGKIVTWAYKPVEVGAKDPQRAKAFGQLLRTATDDNGQKLASNIAVLANQIFPSIKPTNKFMHKKYARYVKKAA